MMKRVLRFTLPLAALLLSAVTAAPAARPTRPNVLLIVADDMGYSDAGCYGGEIHTPNRVHVAVVLVHPGQLDVSHSALPNP